MNSPPPSRAWLEREKPPGLVWRRGFFKTLVIGRFVHFVVGVAVQFDLTKSTGLHGCKIGTFIPGVVAGFS